MGYIEDMRQLVGNRPLILVGAHVILINEKNEMLLQLRSEKNIWCIPGGALECGESLEETAKREVYEETGLITEDLQFFHMFSGTEFFNIYPNGDQIYGVMAVYVCHHFHGSLQVDKQESKDLRFYPYDALPETLAPQHKLILSRINGL
ncbi:NUDIX hydrolase [Bacillus manliponensis]|uniref:NUDIX hydrolase n=1 Tax=Bacillus manliponensis TaxID=574376 RepID=UPI003513026E